MGDYDAAIMAGALGYAGPWVPAEQKGFLSVLGALRIELPGIRKQKETYVMHYSQ